jgi:predicted dehydrogenase
MDGVLRVGVVGMGHRGRLGWLRTLALHPQVRVVAVCDAKEALRLEGAAAANLTARDAHADLDELLGRPDTDAIVVAVEPRHNAAIVARALEAGKHVLCEVPLALTLEECWQVVLAAERSGRTFAMAEQTSYSPFVSAWQQLVADGRLGKVIYGEAQYINGKGLDRYWRDARTGARLTWEEARNNPHAEKTHFWDLYHVILYTTHSLTPLLRVLDDRVVKVTCMGTRRPSYFLEEAVGQQVPLPDIEVALMHTARDTILRLAVGFVSPLPGPEPHHWYHLLGTKGEVETGRRRGAGQAGQGVTGAGSMLWLADHYLNGRVEVEWDLSPYDSRAGRAARSGHGGLDYFPLHDFVESVLQGRRPAIDVYRAADLAGAAVLAAVSDDQGAAPMLVPDFRPGPTRRAGEPPAVDDPAQGLPVPRGIAPQR